MALTLQKKKFNKIKLTENKRKYKKFNKKDYAIPKKKKDLITKHNVFNIFTLKT